jgi:hypothetical protein
MSDVESRVEIVGYLLVSLVSLHARADKGMQTI